MFQLQCRVQNYAWGKVGESSTVAQLMNAGCGAAVDAAKPYAEYWFGTHPNGPSEVVNADGSRELLKDWLKSHPEALATERAQEWVDGEGNLPFLFKVLSVAKALSIQAHPNKARASELHAAQPHVYKDPNHKPEMACAVTEFEALAGFERLSTILERASARPELAALLGDGLATASAAVGHEAAEKEALRGLFAALMQSDAEKVRGHVEQLVQRLSAAASNEPCDTLALRLAGQYPGDVGVFCAYFLCYRKLQPGQAVFLAANEPHAYLAGDCVEIMACSDNVVRAGLTPKLRDVGTLCDMLTYSQPDHAGSETHPGNVLSGATRGCNSAAQHPNTCVVYSPPDPAVREFELEKVNMPPASPAPHALAPSAFGSIVLVLQGNGEAVVDSETVSLRRGGTFFLAAGKGATVKCTDTVDGLLFFRVTTKGGVA